MSDSSEEELLRRVEMNCESAMVISEIPHVTMRNPDEMSIPRSPYPLIEQAAAQLFFNDYVIDESVVSSAFFTNLPELVVKASAGSAIPNVISAVGMATFSYAKRAPNLVRRASQMYYTALRTINVAMTDPMAILSDDTLVVVLMMTLYEEVSFLLGVKTTSNNR